MMAEHRDPWPEVDDPLLKEVVATFRRRSKAIRYQVRSFECVREFEESRTGTLERLNIDCLKLNATMIRLSVWPDGTMWFRVCIPGPRKKGGWALEVSFFGDINDCSPSTVRKMFEKSNSATWHAKDHETVANELETIWSPVKPRDWRR